MSLEGEILSFMGEKNLPLLGKTREWYRYQKLVVPVPIGQRQSEGLVSISIKVVPVPIHNEGLLSVPIKVVPVPLHQ